MVCMHLPTKKAFLHGLTSFMFVYFLPCLLSWGVVGCTQIQMSVFSHFIFPFYQLESYMFVYPRHASLNYQTLMLMRIFTSFPYNARTPDYLTSCSPIQFTQYQLFSNFIYIFNSTGHYDSIQVMCIHVYPCISHFHCSLFLSVSSTFQLGSFFFCLENTHYIFFSESLLVMKSLSFFLPENVFFLMAMELQLGSYFLLAP